MSQAFSESQISEFHSTFAMFDTDGSGEISAPELQACLAKLGQHLALDEVLAMIREVDEDNSGTVGFPEFLTMMASKFSSGDLEREAEEAFRNLFDRDGDGFVSAPELKYVMATLGEECSDQDIREMMIEADKDRDGKVSLLEFKRMILMK